MTGVEARCAGYQIGLVRSFFRARRYRGAGVFYFGSEGLKLLPEIYKIEDVDVLRAVHRALKSVNTLDELRALYT